MNCPFCGCDDHRVVESRVPDSKDAIRRRRECQKCSQRFTTYERVDEQPVMVIKGSGERQAFSRDKLLDGMQRACHKRPVPTADLEVAVGAIEDELRNALRREVDSQYLGDLVLRQLRQIDPVAYVRFASVYRKFGDVDEFARELKDLETDPAPTRDQPSLDEHMFDTMIGAEALDPAARPTRLRALEGGRGRGALTTTTPTTKSKGAPDGD